MNGISEDVNRAMNDELALQKGIFLPKTGMAHFIHSGNLAMLPNFLNGMYRLHDLFQ